jgi:hypothetical protein
LFWKSFNMKDRVVTIRGSAFSINQRPLNNRMAVWSREVLMSFLLVCSAGLCASRAEPANPYPVEYKSLVDGERLEYEAGWNGIPAARATVSVNRDTEYRDLYRISGQARSLGYVSLLWNMRDSLETRIDPRTYWPVSFVVFLHENDWVDIRQGVFHYPENILTMVRRRRQEVQEYTIPTTNATYDALTAAFLLRAIELKVGDAPQAEVCDGQSIYLVRLDVVGTERVKISLGTIPAYRMTVSLKKLYPQESVSENKKKFYGATLWLAADSTRVPLKLESKVFVGHVYIELVSENRGLEKQYGRR